MKAKRNARGNSLPLLLCLCLLVSACGPEDRIPAADFGKAKAGMTQAEVVEVLGEPISIEQDGTTTKLKYRSSDGLQYILLEDDKVTGSGGSAEIEN